MRASIKLKEGKGALSDREAAHVSLSLKVVNVPAHQPTSPLFFALTRFWIVRIIKLHFQANPYRNDTARGNALEKIAP